MVKAKADEHLALALDLFKQRAVDHAEEEYEKALNELEPVSIDTFFVHFRVSGAAFPVSYSMGRESLMLAKDVACQLYGPTNLEYASLLVQLSFLPRILNYFDITEQLLDEYLTVMKANKRSPELKVLEKNGLYAIFACLADVKYQLDHIVESFDLYKEAYRLVRTDLTAEPTDRIRVSLHYSYCLKKLNRYSEAEVVLNELDRYLLYTNTELADDSVLQQNRRM